MPENSEHSTRETGGATGNLRCGDCRMTLTARQPLRCEPGEFYCPGCARSAAESLTCPHCGSLICPCCGTALESTDELGIG